MTREKLVDRRNKPALVALACLALTILVVCGVAALTSGSDGQKYVFMTEGDGMLAKLEMVVGPEGEITEGTHVLVRLSDVNGNPVFRPEEKFGGTVTDGIFKLTGLSDHDRDYTGPLRGNTLDLDGTFGVNETKWKRIPSAAPFNEAVDGHAKSLEGCEQEGYLGCDEG